jgi:serine/threonine-protein kinase/endoribonuclease IRE1
MGLGKKLDVHRSSFDSTVTGSVGWQAPEMLRALTLTLGDASDGDAGSASEGSESSGEWTMTSGEDARGRSDRLSKAVDVFSAGCVMYYAATSGRHPFGEPVERELNIARY